MKRPLRSRSTARLNPARPHRPHPSFAAVCAAALVLCGCNAQIFPQPMKDARRPLPPGAAANWVEGPEEVTVVRHADPVRLRTPGALSGYPVRFYEKTQRVRAGTGVIASAGGKVEVVWPLGTAIMMFGPATGVVGSTSRGEPTFVFEELGRARLDLLEGDIVRLLGGAILTGPSGPYLVELVRDEVIRVTNQSKQPVSVAFRQADFELGPGQRVDLPLVHGGGAPRAGFEGFQTVSGPGFAVEVQGEASSDVTDRSVEIASEGTSLVRGLGVLVDLPPGQRATFTGLREGREPSEPAGSDDPSDESLFDSEEASEPQVPADSTSQRTTKVDPLPASADQREDR